MTFRQPFKNEWPITQKYGETITSSFHTGIDYGTPIGTNILASADGTVCFAGWDKTGYGNFVILNHGNVATAYAHLSVVSVALGQKVKQGEKIGESGNTGNSTGPHLHFEARRVWNDYKSHFDPMNLPLISMYDAQIPSKSSDLNIPKPGDVVIVSELGAFGHNSKFNYKTIFSEGTELQFSGKTVERNGLTFCECSIWIAAHDGDTQILANVG